MGHKADFRAKAEDASTIVRLTKRRADEDARPPSSARVLGSIEMLLIHEVVVMGAWVKVFSDRVEYKPGWLNGIEIIPVSQIASIKLGNWYIRNLTIETTGGRAYVVLTRKKQAIADAIYRAQAALQNRSLSPPVAYGIADEIAKFAGLRDQGILSNQEFESYKAGLLRGDNAPSAPSTVFMQTSPTAQFSAALGSPELANQPQTIATRGPASLPVVRDSTASSTASPQLHGTRGAHPPPLRWGALSALLKALSICTAIVTVLASVGCSVELSRSRSAGDFVAGIFASIVILAPCLAITWLSWKGAYAMRSRGR
jgi:hypothetical protein